MGWDRQGELHASGLAFLSILIRDVITTLFSETAQEFA